MLTPDFRITKRLVRGSGLPPYPLNPLPAPTGGQNKKAKAMARPTKPATVKLSKLVQFRVTDAESLQLQQTAEASGLSESDYCRGRILNSKPRRRKSDPDRLALIADLGSLGHIRADINQLLKDRWAYKYVTPEQVQKVFSDIEAIADKIQNDLSDGD